MAAKSKAPGSDETPTIAPTSTGETPAMAPASTAEISSDNVLRPILAHRVLVVSAPAGPRRRAGLEFGPEPRDLREEDMGDDPEATFDALRADPRLKINARLEEVPAEE